MDATHSLDFLQHLVWKCDLHALLPFLHELRQQCDVRLVRTAARLLRLLASTHEHTLQVRSLSDTLACPQIRSGAWEKRIHKLLDSPKWSHHLIEQHLWRQADELVCQAIDTERQPLVLWDESVWEKPETLHDPRLGPVVSGKAKRLNRVKPGYYSPPKGHTCVPGYRINALVVATSKHARLARCDYWHKSNQGQNHWAELRTQMLCQATQSWGGEVIHVFDRGYAGWPWLEQLFEHQVRFVIRWKSSYAIKAGEKSTKVHHSVSGKKRVKLMVKDALKRKKKARWVVWRQVTHPKAPSQPMWLVVCSDKKRAPWYLLTSEPITGKEDARRIISIYSRRWEIEQHFKRMKTEFRSETVQLRNEDKRLKMLGLLGLVHNGLMMLNRQEELKVVLLDECCPRRGKRLNQEIKVAFSRLRKARQKLREWLEQTNERFWSYAPESLVCLLGLPP